NFLIKKGFNILPGISSQLPYHFATLAQDDPFLGFPLNYDLSANLDQRGFLLEFIHNHGAMIWDLVLIQEKYFFADHLPHEEFCLKMRQFVSFKKGFAFGEELHDHLQELCRSFSMQGRYPQYRL